jgi:O-antigen ligase/tetratricopeptide (TPR) repeat protein
MADIGDPPFEGQPFRSLGVRIVQASMEAILLAMVVAAPWFFGAVHPGYEFYGYVGVGLLLVLWGVRMFLEGQLTWVKCPVAPCLAGLILLGCWQMTPLSRPVLEWVSPSAARMYDQLLPSQPEELPGDESSTEIGPAGRTISFYPGATRAQTLRLLAVLLVFAVVRNNLASASRLRRLCLVCLVNGFALSLFAIVQLFSSPRNTIYWTYPALGQVYGPFICRNHFPFYVNMCLGLGAGLLLSRTIRGSARQVSRGRSASQEGTQAGSLPSLLQDPAALWISLALALMVSSVALSLSRGGFLALIGGFGSCFFIRFLRSPHSLRLGVGVFIGGLALALIGWFGVGAIQARWGALWKGQSLEESRLAVWARVLPLAGDFPIWGTGYATFEHVEPLQRTSAADANIAWDHAHNDYVEILVEGGLIGLALGLLTIGLVYWLGCRALRRHAGRSVSGLAFGAVIAFTTLVIHSVVDFGLHIPAIALLATVLCAHLCGLGDLEPHSTRNAAASDAPAPTAPQYRFRMGGLAPLVGAATCVGLGVLLSTSGWKAFRADRLQWAAAQVSGTDADSQQRRLGYLEQAAALEPDDVVVLVYLSDVRIGAYEEHERKRRAGNRMSMAATAFIWPAPGMSALALASAWIANDAANQELARADHAEQTRGEILPALRSSLAARNACPLLPQPQLAIAAFCDRLKRADPRGAYLERAKLLAPANPVLWYLCGVQELEGKQPAKAWASWRRCLELSDAFLPEILATASPLLDAHAIVQMVLPDRPEIVLAAASRLYPDEKAFAKRRPFLQHALNLLEAQAAPLNAEELHTKALVHKSLGQFEKTEETYQNLLKQYPEQANYRLEFAQFLHSQGRLQEARRELLIVIAQQPQNGQARDLLNIVGPK